MASITSAINTEKWGKETEKHFGAIYDGVWDRDMYVDDIPWENGRFRELLENYSKIPPSEVEAEISRIRDKAWNVAKYPCIGFFAYLRLNEFDDSEPEMHKAVERLKAPGSKDAFLEIGGFICHTIRWLTYIGVDSERLYGTDLHDEFLELGYKQFRDRSTSKATFVAGDILLPDEEYAASPLAQTFNGKMSVIHASNFFHLFSWESQLVICERIVRFFKPGLGAAGDPAVLFGYHRCSDSPGETDKFRIYLHSEATFQSLWDEVGKRTATSWKVTMEPLPIPILTSHVFGREAKAMRYVVRQVVVG
ncbi:uncharacterized protein F4812DRAFT_427875 [Daldinia caldariorum]|uniref:uncharacterized protein n=1 Tax=Daldinia caldariorum TaxID=326644 RepID=UPI0020083A82|nr:uncharacterized protein F4812DRAFT_427875 [Daldinia caldariorum]KAI1467862.1 hypothetical protein F4812DRAFT_427875 [Daldinia caldariorum]